MNKDKRNNIQLLCTLNNADESGIIANASQIYDGVAQKSVEERITDLDNKIASAVATETSRAQEAEANRYTKNETYTKEELNNLITTPNQKYVSVTATDQTTAVTDVLPAIGLADTVYRVGNWDGSQYDVTKYSEYAWNGKDYVHISTKTQIGDVFDISAYHATGGTLATYDNLEDALGTNGKNIPQSLRKGGMSVKFVQSSDNKYVQYRLMSDSFGTIESDWQNIGLVQQIGLSETVAMSQKAVTEALTKSSEIQGEETQNYMFGYLDVYGRFTPNKGFYTSFPINIDGGTTIIWNKGAYNPNNSNIYLVEFDGEGHVSKTTNTGGEHVLLDSTRYIAASFGKNGERSITKKDGTIIFEPKIISNIMPVVDKVVEIDSALNKKEKLTFDIYKGYYIDANGKQRGDSHWCVTDYIPLTGAKFEKLSIDGHPLVNSASFYDENHTYIYGFLGRYLSLPNFIWGSECKYVRFSIDIQKYVEDKTILINKVSNIADKLEVLDSLKDKLQNCKAKMQYPSVVYNVGNDIDTNTFERNFCASIYMDNLIGEFMREEPLLRFDNGCIKRNIACYVPIGQAQAYGSFEKPLLNGGKSTYEETIKIGIKNSDYTDGFSIINRCTLNTKSKGNARILILGDSVTAGQNAYFPNSMMHADYTSLLKQMFDKDNLQSSSTDYNLMTLGTMAHTRKFSYNGENKSIKAFNEGYSGQTLSWLFNSSNMVVNGSFSFDNWLNKYRTCDEHGNRLYFDTQKKTRGNAGTSNKGYLENGTDSGLFIGSMVTDTLAWDVCEPTHVFLAYGNNAAITKNEYDKFISYVKASFPKALIGLGITKVSGTFFPSQYPNMSNVALWDAYMQAESFWNRQKACQVVLDEIAKDVTYEQQNVFVIPLYYVNPSADAISAIKINEPYRDSEDGEDTYLAKGQHPDVHVGGKAHAAYAYQLYSWIKWTIAKGLIK